MTDKAITEYLKSIGSKGGKQRAKNMSAKELKEAMRKAANARWNKKGKKKET